MEKKTILEKIMLKVKQSNFMTFCTSFKKPIYENNLVTFGIFRNNNFYYTIVFVE